MAFDLSSIIGRAEQLLPVAKKAQLLFGKKPKSGPAPAAQAPAAPAEPRPFALSPLVLVVAGVGLFLFLRRRQ